MKLGVFFFGTVPMPDAGANGPDPVSRRYGPADFAEAYSDMEHWAVLCDGLGYESMWLTEHHFQHEGYEVVPNCVLLSAVLAQKTRDIRFGAMFNIVPQWHPLKLAEDFAMADLLSGGRLIFGVGRGTVAREALCLGTTIGSTDWDMVGMPEVAAAADATNREQFEEGMEVIRRAFTGEPFSFQGKHYQYPPPRTPDRGRFAEAITLVPSPIHLPVDIWQPVTSEPTMHYVAREGISAVFWNHGYDGIRERWQRFGQVAQDYGRNLGRGGGRMLIVNVHIGPTIEQALATATPGFEEFQRFLEPYGRKPGEKGASGHSGRAASVEEAVASRAWFVGPPAHIAGQLQEIIDELGVEYLTIMVHWPGMTRAAVDEQVSRFRNEVLPLLEAQPTVATGAGVT